ncbi:unnamed protein product [Closterium sp. NIES-54]
MSPPVLTKGEGFTMGFANRVGYGRTDSNGAGGLDGGLHGPDGSAGRAGVGGSRFSTDDDVDIGPPGRAREGYTSATINTGVNQGTAGAQQGTDWRSTALDEEDQLHSGLAHVLALPWPDTGLHGDALHADADEPGFEDVDGEGVGGGVSR